ncbi:MAG: Rhodomycin D methylesterase DauP [Alphaproteobacteria bacterium]|nr:MAG: Rhodomycin D methylesterase DauP [Alphaproteobacteria bacterium]
MAFANANGLKLCYEVFEAAEKSDPAPLILIRGLGTQMVQWPQAFIDYFTAAGLDVIVFDNRDVGESDKLDAAGVPDLMALMAGVEAGAGFPVPYGLADMAEDVIGLMDALAIEKAHIWGMSLGGMVAQHLAFSHATRIGKVICVMSTSGDASLPTPATGELTPPDNDDEGELIDYMTENLAQHASPAFPTPLETRRALATKIIQRCWHPQGVIRQMAAALADGSRTQRLKEIRLPFMVIHGDADTLIDISCGRHIADTVPGAVWRPVTGMGHDIGLGLEDEIGPDVLAFLGLT